MKLISIPGDSAVPTPAADNSAGVMSALRRAASETGTDFGYLLNTAMRESSLNPAAQAATSSAAGLFQFIEQTWLGMVRQHGAEHGLKAYADAIEVGSNGRLQVADGALRKEILALRKDPQTAALMAGEMTNQMRGDMEAELGRGVSAGELYAAHFLGPTAAMKLIKTAAENPGASAPEMFPQAAAANRSIFYAKDGQARSASGVMAALSTKHGDTPLPESMVAANEPARDTAWRGMAPDASLPASFTPVQGSFTSDQALFMAPIMVQLLAALDPVPHVAALLGTEEPELRRTGVDSI